MGRERLGVQHRRGPLIEGLLRVEQWPPGERSWRRGTQQLTRSGEIRVGVDCQSKGPKEKFACRIRSRCCRLKRSITNDGLEG